MEQCKGCGASSSNFACEYCGNFIHEKLNVRHIGYLENGSEILAYIFKIDDRQYIGTHDNWKEVHGDLDDHHYWKLEVKSKQIIFNLNNAITLIK